MAATVGAADIELASRASAPVTGFVALADDGANSNLASASSLPPPSSWLTDSRRRTIVTCMYMSVFAVMGCLLRIGLAQLFGEACKNPGSVGWLAAGEPICVTDQGRVSREGGIIFADLPANLLGCFVMGMMQTAAVLGLPSKKMPVAWARSSSAFQNWDILHLAIRTGFCGSLTTFSSWNSEMVILIYAVGNNRRTQVGLAILGYIIGIETALGSFVFGKNVASWLHNWMNPDLAWEADASRDRKAKGVHINANLPDFERRYLPELDKEVQYYDLEVHVVGMLERWRATTKQARLITSDELPLLDEIETHVLVHKMDLTENAREKAEKLGWDVKALEAWASSRKANESSGENDKPLYEQMHVALPIFAIVIGLLAFGIGICNEDTAVSITYRTMWYSCLLAPLGAICRWKLSSLNGKLRNPWSWMPVGTLTANVLACIISITMIAVELLLHGTVSEWVTLTFLAIKIGIAGCLSTVSTFISEASSLMAPPSQYKGYKYVLLTLITSCLVGVALYGWIVYVIGGGNPNY